jgi:hypothetical protein
MASFRANKARAERIGRQRPTVERRISSAERRRNGQVRVGGHPANGNGHERSAGPDSDRDDSSRPGGAVSGATASLLNHTTQLARLLITALEGRRWLDAYLLAAGMDQIVADQLHSESDRPDGARPGSELPLVWARRLASLVDRLADAVAGQAPAPARRGELVDEGLALAHDLGRLPERFRRDLVRLPACFHHLDQEPADLGRLVDLFAERWPDRERPLLAVGVRSSGSYLAPLHAALLRARGYQSVRVLTVRPGHGLLEPERGLVRSLARRGGLALLCDDPPVTGASIARVANELQGAGLPADAIVLLLQLFAGESLPPNLHRFHAVLLPWIRWAVIERLRPERVERMVSDLLAPGSSLVCATPVPLPKPRSPRRHARARYRLRVRDATGVERDEEIVVEGAGLGYFGAAAAAGSARGPRVFGIENGLLCREWLPEEETPRAVEPLDEDSRRAESAVESLGGARRFPVAEDLGLGVQPA